MEEYKKLLEVHVPPPPVDKTVWVSDASLCILYAEFRPLDIIKYNLYNLCHVYGGSDTTLAIVHGRDNKDVIHEITKDWKNVKYVEMPYASVNIHMYNDMFRSFSFWDKFSAHTHVLTNQWDSYLFRRIPEKFFAYDFIGAPTGHTYVRTSRGFINICSDKCECERCLSYTHEFTESSYVLKPDEKRFSMFNGGFSLRKVEAMKRITQKHKNENPAGMPEDIFFCLQEDIHKPDRMESVEFSVQSFPYDGIPVGSHKIWELGEHYVRRLFRTVDFGKIVGRFYLKQDLGLDDDDTPDLTTVSELIETYPMWSSWVRDIPTKRKQLFTMFETSDVHPDIIKAMKVFDKVIVPYDYLKNILVAHGVNCEALNWYTSPLIRHAPRVLKKKRDPNNLVFLYVGTNDIRKNLKKLTHTFEKLKHTLIVKTNTTTDLPEARNIKYITGRLTLDEMAGLYNTCDYVISFTHGEGVGLPMLEAKYFKKPVVCHAGGVLETLRDDSWIVLPHKEIEIDKTQVPPFLQKVFHGTWWEVDGDIHIDPIKIYYRLSDKGRRHDKPDFINGQNCLRNFCQHFDPKSITVIADNCEEETIDMISAYIDKSQIIRTSLGNSGAFLFAAKKAIEENGGETIVYLVEDDYMHIKDSQTVLKEGISLADYVTLYDHPDKYLDGPNPYVKDGGEQTKVLLTKSTHWKYTNSTTMTFATRVKTLREDLHILEKYCKEKIPDDFHMFCELYSKKRRLVSPLPGRATHGQLPWLCPLVEWYKE